MEIFINDMCPFLLRHNASSGKTVRERERERDGEGEREDGKGQKRRIGYLLISASILCKPYNHYIRAHGIFRVCYPDKVGATSLQHPATALTCFSKSIRYMYTCVNMTRSSTVLFLFSVNPI